MSNDPNRIDYWCPGCEDDPEDGSLEAYDMQCALRLGFFEEVSDPVETFEEPDLCPFEDEDEFDE